MTSQWPVLVAYQRGGLSEVLKHGAVCWFSGDKVIHRYGSNVHFYGRSAVKPFHMKVFAQQLDSILNSKQKAITLSSHNAEAIHVDAVKSILQKGDLSLMQTPHAAPMQQFGKQLRRPRRYYHTCSGEHAGVLRGCLEKSWPRSGYTLPQHPFHQHLKIYLRKILGPQWQAQHLAKDGCGLPTFSFYIEELAKMFAQLTVEKDADWIWSSMVEHPDLIGGFNRLDSTVLKSCGGQVIAKEGADGIVGLSILHEKFPQGLGVVVKLAHGIDFQAAWYVVRGILGSLGFALRNPYKIHRQLAVVSREVVPDFLQKSFAKLSFRDPWDPLDDRWQFDESKYGEVLCKE